MLKKWASVEFGKFQTKYENKAGRSHNFGGDLVLTYNTLNNNNTNLPNLFRAAARFRVADAYTRMDLSGMSEQLAQSYNNQVGVLLCMSAVESYSTLFEKKGGSKDSRQVFRIVGEYISEAANVDFSEARAELKEELVEKYKTVTRDERNVDRVLDFLRSGKSECFLAYAKCVRDCVAHGLVGGSGSIDYTATFRAMKRVMREGIVKHMDIC